MEDPKSSFESYYRIGKGRIIQLDPRKWKWPRGNPFRSNGKIQWGKILLWTAIAGIGSIILFIALVYFGAFGRLPESQELLRIQHANASEIYGYDPALQSSDKSVLLGKYYIENRSSVEFEDLPPHLVNALIATEDVRFLTHGGIDWKSLGRVFVKSLLLQDESSGGGSTLTQQLAKNLYPRERWGLFTLPVAKVREMFIARRLESAYQDKMAILTLYLNTVPFGERVFGIGAAAQRYFSTTPERLTIEQSATLVGMLKATSYYNPQRHPDRALQRRNVVMDQMVRYGYLPAAKAESLKATDLNPNYSNLSYDTGLAPYFRQMVGQQVKEWLKAYNETNGTSYNLYTDGLKVYTTIDVRLQAYAEEAVEDHMKQLQTAFDKHWSSRELWKPEDRGIIRAMKQSDRYRGLKAQGKSDEEIKASFAKPVPMRIWTWDGYEEREMSPMDSLIHYNSFLHAGLMAMDPRDGYIRAWVGGINYRHFKYDHVTAQRQVGSTFKPIIYASALANGMDPCTYIPNEKVVYEQYKNWAPGNADGDYGGYYSLKGGLVNSVNTVSAAVMMQVGVDNAVNFAQRFGFEKDLPRDPSLVLGTADLSVREMVGAYSSFANEGVRAIPVAVVKIVDARGKVLIEWPEERGRHRVMSEDVANQMVSMLQAVVDSGTARRLRFTYGLRTAIAGKTGTTQNQTDGWFMGVTPKLIVGTWVGGDDRKVRFRSLSLGQGANTALPIFGQFMKQTYQNKQYRHLRNAQFSQLSPRLADRMDCVLYSDEGFDPSGSELIDLLRQLQKESEERRKERERPTMQDRWDRLFNRDDNN